LPKEVRSVTEWWTTYVRTWVKLEFFKEWTNRRLIIREDTHIDKIETWDIKELEEKNSKATTEYIKNNPEANDFTDIVAEAYDRDIDPGFAVLAFSDNIKNMPLISIQRQVLIEEMFTEFARKRAMVMWAVVENSMDGKYEKWKYIDELAIRVLKEFSWDKWKDKAKEYWITEDRINVVETQIQQKYMSYENIWMNAGVENIGWNLPFVPRLQNTWNVAEDLNNPANLIAWWIWDKYAIWKVRSPNWRIFLVFRDVEHWMKAMSADIEAKQSWRSKVISWNDSLNNFIDVWVWNDWTQWTRARSNYKNIVISELGKTYWNISLNQKFSNFDSFKLAIALSKAEWFRWWNSRYLNYEVS
jgi:hypothetical protein